MPRLRQVERKPCEKEPGERGYAILADIDAYQHAMAQQHLHRGPCEGVLFRARLSVGIHQATAAFDGFNLRRRDARMILDTVDVREPDQREHNAERAQEPEAALPTVPMKKPSEDGREDRQREVL